MGVAGTAGPVGTMTMGLAAGTMGPAGQATHIPVAGGDLTKPGTH